MPNQTLFYHASLVVITVTAATQAFAQRTAVPDSIIQSAITARVESGFSTGIVAGVLRPDGTRSYFTAGTSGRTDLPLDSQTVFEIGSITKAFTGTLLAQMVTAGDARLDDPVQSLLPSTVTVPSRGGKQITLLDLTTHTSALPRLPGNFTPADPANPYASYTEGELYTFISGHSLARDIGTQYEYSNLAVGLLGNALARKAGASYEQALIDRVLGPAGLADTRITLTPSMRQRLALGHDGGGNPASNWDIPALAGAGALRSTASDMLDFLAANVSPTAPLAEAYRLAREPRRQAGPGMHVGLGWHIREAGDRAIVWHNGETGGYHSFAGFDPETAQAVVILSNSASNIDDIGFHILDSTFRLVASRSMRPIDVPADVLDRYIGVYELSPTFAITVTREGSALVFQATAQPKFRSIARSNTEFHLPSVDARITFDVAADGTVTQLVLHQGGRSTPGRRKK